METTNFNNANATNVIGIAGFVMSITALVLCWVPVLKWLLLIPALLLSLIGMTKSPRAFAAIGAIVSGLVIFVLMAVKILFWSALYSCVM